MWLIVAISFFTIIYFGIRCYLNLFGSSTVKKSAKFKNLQSQLFLALVSQTLIPVILMQIPTTILFLCTFLDADLGEFSGLVTMTVSLFPAIDPIPTMFIVKNYRLANFGFFRTRVIVVAKK
ncbi:unnamed protein product [Caenorhabditis angaria]|uniref:7TM GPCR serpentine receptor class x (Srx) domain-containing protein n=1 Tax=Caenorhabditis angaria TaxID=860376 RepID=A0A9P1IRC9_9PELO|nr:unnamed protein product [Caenorhabditis angaria]